MNDYIILRTDAKKFPIFPKLKVYNLENGLACRVNRNSSSLRKLVNQYSNKNIIISRQCEKEKIFQGKTKIADTLRKETALPILEKICRKTAEKFNCQLPLRSVFIVGEPQIACRVIAALRNISHLFVVVSEKKPMGAIYDELYFQYGTMIRHMPYIKNAEGDSVVVKIEPSVCAAEIKAPIIDMSDNPINGHNVVDLHRIYVKDNYLFQTQRIWGGKSGLILFGMLGITPNDNSIIDINNVADDIFLLDTGAV